MTTADPLRAEGEARGRDEGRVEGRAETLLDLLGIKFAGSDIEELIRTSSASQLEIWTRRIPTATTLDDIFA